ncbi:MAG: hypothetical protein ACHQE6_04725 [Solirubrobacterales bacterium]
MPLVDPDRPSGSSELLVTLGILTINWNENRDSVANFAPFIVQALKETEDHVVTVGGIQDLVRHTFDLQIPQGALNTILRRATREGYATIEHGVLSPNHAKLADFDLRSKRADVERQRAALLVRLRRFAEVEFHMTWSPRDVEKALLAYVSAQAMPLLAATVGGEKFHTDEPVRHSEVVVNRFVQSLCAEDPVGLRYLVTFVKGSMLANALYLPEGFGSIKRHFGSTHIYLDTRLVLEAIGYADEAISQPVRELVELLRRFNASMRIFEHTVREIEGILDTAARLLKTRSSEPYEGSVLEYFLKMGINSADAERLIASLPTRLERAEIEVVAPPPHSRSLGLDERRLASVLRDAIPHQREEARQHDVDSLTAIHRLRSGRPYRRLESCPAIFVTTNATLVSASAAYFHEAHRDQSIPICIHDHAMTTLAWLKDPAGASDLPRKQMIADSFAAMDPPTNLWRKYLEEAKRLCNSGSISEDDFIMLRFSVEARQALMTLTYGDSEFFTEGTVPEVLARAKRNAAAEAEEKARKTALAEQAQRYWELSLAVAMAVSGALFMLTTVVLVIGLSVPAGNLLPSNWHGVVPVLASTCIVVALMLGLTHAIAGESLLDLARRLRRVLADRIFNLMSRVLSPRESP